MIGGHKKLRDRQRQLNSKLHFTSFCCFSDRLGFFNGILVRSQNNSVHFTAHFSQIPRGNCRLNLFRVFSGFEPIAIISSLFDY
jgi:hypothetical protein